MSLISETTQEYYFKREIGYNNRDLSAIAASAPAPSPALLCGLSVGAGGAAAADLCLPLAVGIEPSTLATIRFILYPRHPP